MAAVFTPLFTPPVILQLVAGISTRRAALLDVLSGVQVSHHNSLPSGSALTYARQSSRVLSKDLESASLRLEARMAKRYELSDAA